MSTSPWHKFATSTLAITFLAAFIAPPVPAATASLGRVDATGGAGSTTPIDHWDIQSSAKAQQGGQAISEPGFPTRGWYGASAHATVMAGLLENGL